jgi:hypothetical protein
MAMNFTKNYHSKSKIILVSLFIAIICVGVFEYWIFKKQGAKIPVPNKQFHGIDISNWKTYHNNEFGFEIKYPKEWATTEDRTQWGKKYSMYSSELAFDILVIPDNPSQRFFDILTAQTRDVLEDGVTVYSIQEYFNVSGFTSIIFYADRSQQQAIFPQIRDEAILKKDNNIFHFMLIGGAKIVRENKGIFKQILSTFQFTE